MVSQPELKDNEAKIRPQTPEEKERNNKDVDIPKYRIRLDLNQEQENRLTEGFFKEFDAIKEERKQSNAEKNWESSDHQYDGAVKQNPRLKFNLHVHQSRIKEDAIVRACNEAFCESDPKFAVEPRPDFTGKNGIEIAEKQSNYLDFALDEEIKPSLEFTNIFRSAVRKYVGIQKLSWAFKRERRKREEDYEGKITPVGIKGNQIIVENEGLKAFLNQYPDAQDRYPGLVKRLAEGKDISVVVEYMDTIDNNPEISHVKIENFYVRNSVRGNKGLRDTHCIAERQSYTWWELLEKEKEDEWQNIEDLKFEPPNPEANEEERKELGDHETRDFNVLEGTYYFKLNEEDEDEIKMKCWFSEENRVFLGAILYPYYGFDADYKAYYVFDNGKGFYGDGESVIHSLRDSNIAQNALLSLALHGAYARNILTPITRAGSDIEKQILDNKWSEGMPLSVEETDLDVSKALSFVQYQPMDIGAMISLNQVLKRQDGDVTGVSDLTTGQESSIDPRAPAAKTIALLQVSGVNIKDYIRTLAPSFNETGTEILQLYYQMSTQSRKFRVRAKSNKVSGGDIFQDISRDEMVAKTNIQTRAMIFAFDKVNEKKENVALMQLLLSHPVALQRPGLIFESFKLLMKSWSTPWKNVADKLLPSPEEFEREMQQAAIQAVINVAQAAQKQEEVTGVKPNIDLSALAGAVAQAQQEAVLGAQEEKK